MQINPLWYVCLLTRVLISGFIYFSTFFQSKIVDNISSIVLLSMGLGFIYKSLYGSNEEFQVSKVFWHNARPVHGMLYILAGLYLYFGEHEISSILVFVDILFSILYRFITNK